MLNTDTKLDTLHTERRSRPESKQQLEYEQRIFPPDLPSTHTWDYRWEDPTAEAKAKNPYLLPELVLGPRELTLAEVGARSDNFAALNHGELRWLFDKYKMLAVVPPKGKQLDEKASLLESVRAHAKMTALEPVKKSVAKQSAATSHVALTPEIASMNAADIETKAFAIGAGEEFKEKIAGKTLPLMREWLAGKLSEKKELEPAA